MGDSSRRVAVLATLMCACGTGENRVDPGDLELRDLLGVAPEVATAWTSGQRASARHVLDDGMRESGDPVHVALGTGRSLDEQVARSLADIDADRFAGGAGALGLVRVTVSGDAAVSGVLAPGAGDVLAGDPPPASGTVEISDAWSAELAARGQPMLTVLAADAGASKVVVVPAPRLPVIAAEIEPGGRLLVNPVLLAALEPSGGMTTTTDEVRAPEGSPVGVHAPLAKPDDPTAGNPYSFYGSFEECAAAQQSRCDLCVSQGSCTPITNTSDGVAECNQLAANNGRGYFLICINLSLAITAVDKCAATQAASCPQNDHATTSLTDLEANADFLDMAACGAGLDACLADIYGAPPQPFPGLDGGVQPSEPPRQTAVACTNSCDNNNTTFNPDCNCSGPSCNNSLSCDSGCSNSNTQSGCDSCSSDSGGGGGGGGGCDGGGGSSSSSGGCGGCDNSSSSSSGGSCGGCNSSSGSSSGGGCSGGGCDNSSGGSCGGSGGGGCSGGGGGGKCEVARNDSAGIATAVSVAWALLPIGIASRVRRKAKKKRVGDGVPEEVQS